MVTDIFKKVKKGYSENILHYLLVDALVGLKNK